MTMKLMTKRNLYALTFLVSLTAMLGSLYFSEIIGLTPCLLCWYQRIMMYPIVPLSLVGLWYRDHMLPKYVLPLSVAGFITAGYHYVLQMYKPAADNPLFNFTKGSVACTTIDISFFGFITIPLLSFMAFVLISVALYLSLRAEPS